MSSINNLFSTVPGRVDDISVTELSQATFSISWSPPNALGTVVSQYIICSSSITCPHDQSKLIVHSNTAMSQIILKPGQEFIISVKVRNVLGDSTAAYVSYLTPAQGEKYIS